MDFEFRNFVLQKAIGVVFTEAVHRMVAAFLKRARVVYGAPAVEISPAAQAAIAGQSQMFALGSFTQTNATGPFTVKRQA